MPEKKPVRPPKGGDQSPIPQDERVVVSVKEGRTLVVRPHNAIIRKHQPLRFAVEGLPAGMSVEIDFEVYEGRKGPFPWREKPGNPVRGRYLLDPKNPLVDSTDSDVAGYFKYHVVLRKGSEDVFALDPGVVVKNDF
ncbi:MAG TPA: hypothetical protein VFO85_13360 [Vicinamibacteria bacterium]|nr:hypothetical protein [Vicinamibacteria bacterium]